MIVIALIALLLAVLFGIAVFMLILDFVVRVFRLLIRVAIALIFAGGVGGLAAAIAGTIDVDPITAGLGGGMLSFLAALVLLLRSSNDGLQRTQSAGWGREIVPPAGMTAWPGSRNDTTPTEPPMVSAELAERLASATQAVRDRATAEPLDIPVVEWCSVLDRVPELIAETQAVARTASMSDRADLRAGLATDLERLIVEADRRLATKSRERLAILRRWVAIRTGSN